MTLDTLAQLGEFVGGFFVLVSLVYLAHQVRQNTRSLRTENYARVLDRMSTLQATLSSDGELNYIVITGASALDRLTPLERIRFSWAMYEVVGAVEFMYHQAREDALPEMVWSRWQATLVWWLSWPGVRAWWAAKPQPLSADFEAFAEDLIRGEALDPEVSRRWETFVAGESPPGVVDPNAEPAGGAGMDG